MHPRNYSDLRNASLAGTRRAQSPSPDENDPVTSGVQSHPGGPRAPPLDRIVRERECETITGLSRVTLWRLERAGEFPRRRKITSKCVGWLWSEVAEWLRSREAA